MGNNEFRFGEIIVPPRTRKDIRLNITEIYTSVPLYIPVTVINGIEKGPTLFVTAALHGNELNGIEMVRLIRSFITPEKLAGTLLLVAIANPISFINQARELPDRRDLNRAFPGSSKGSIAGQIAHSIFEKIVKRSNYGIDLHTAAHGRTNLPHVRADMRSEEVKRLASAFGTKVIFDMPGEKTTLRYTACKEGIPTIVYESGEPMKFERELIKIGVLGIRNVMAELGMIDIKRVKPKCQVVVNKHKWIRAQRGGILIMNVKPGDMVKKGDEIAFNTKPLGTELDVLKAPFSGLVVGVTTIPMAIPGSAVAHIVKVDSKRI